MATNDRDLRSVAKVTRAAVNGRERSHSLRYAYRVVGNQRLQGASANCRANNTSKAQAGARLGAIDSNLGRRLNDFSNDGITRGSIGLERFDLDRLRFLGRVLKVSIDDVGGGNVHANFGRDARAVRYVFNRASAYHGARASFLVLADRQFIFHLYGVFVDGRASRAAIRVRGQ